MPRPYAPAEGADAAAAPHRQVREGKRERKAAVRIDPSNAAASRGAVLGVRC